MTKPEQLLLDLPHRAASGRDDFLVTESNAAAVRLVDDWPQWPSRVAILVGPEDSGKSHLAQVWQARSGATVEAAQGIGKNRVGDLLATKTLCLEDLSAGHFDEVMLFHDINQAKQESGHVLLTSRQMPHEWQVRLPDLASRLGSFPIVQILAPDDVLLRGVLVKLFSDRQIHVDEALISYILLRMPRSLAAARALVDEIDSRSLREKVEITRIFVGRVMAEHESPDFFNL